MLYIKAISADRMRETYTVDRRILRALMLCIPIESRVMIDDDHDDDGDDDNDALHIHKHV